MPLDIAQMSKLIEENWRNTIQETSNHSALFWDRLKSKDTKNINDRGEKWKVRTMYNESQSGASFDGADYARGGNSKFENLTVPYRTLSHTGEITQATLDNAPGQNGFHPLVEEMNMLRKTAARQLNTHCLMDDGTGKIAVLTAVASGSTVTSLPAANVFGHKGVQFVKPGKVVQIYNSTGLTQRTAGGADKLVVSDTTVPNLTTGVITFTSAAPTDVVATDIVVPEGMAGRGINGLSYWVANSGNLFDLSRTTHPGLQSTMVDGASGALLVLVETFWSKLAFKTEEEVVTGKDGAGDGGHEIFWSPTQREKYRKEGLGTAIGALGAKKYDGGYGQREELNGYTCTMIKDHDNTRINFLRLNDWYKVGINTVKPFSPVQADGNSVLYNKRSATGGLTSTLAYTIRATVNIACEDVRSQGAIYGLPTSGLETGNS